MKKVLVTSQNSYIGNQFKKWIRNNDKNIKIDFVSVRNDLWKKKDFSEYDVILHLAGIAHVSRNPRYKDLYYKVNTDLTSELAKKAAYDGTSQFIFLSSIIVFGDAEYGKQAIKINTIPSPNNFYGDSKWQAEKSIEKLQSSKFNISIIRSPMIYGPKSKGNFNSLYNNIDKIKLLPYISNKRSMLYIDNLCEVIYDIISNNRYGIFHPQNKELIGTKDMIKEIIKTKKNKIFFVEIKSKILKKILFKFSIVRKIFGDFYYDVEDSFTQNINMKEFKDTIKLIERVERVEK